LFLLLISWRKLTKTCSKTRNHNNKQYFQHFYSKTPQKKELTQTQEKSCQLRLLKSRRQRKVGLFFLAVKTASFCSVCVVYLHVVVGWQSFACKERHVVDDNQEKEVVLDS